MRIRSLLLLLLRDPIRNAAAVADVAEMAAPRVVVVVAVAQPRTCTAVVAVTSVSFKGRRWNRGSTGRWDFG